MERRSTHGIPPARQGGRNPFIRLITALFGLIAALAAADSRAHRFWIEPSSFTVEAGGRIGVRLCVGDGFEAWPLPRSEERIEKFVAAGGLGEWPVVGLDGADPAGAVRLAAPDPYVIAYRGNRAYTELAAAEFEEYLRDEGLDRLAARASARGEQFAKVREAYSRHAKALVRAGSTDGAAPDRPMGLRLELVAEPGLLRGPDGSPRFFRLLHEGRPLGGALVTAARPGTADEEVKVRTGADGRAGFVLRAPGMWRIAAVHLVRPPRGVRADWESLWASLTFELPHPSASTAHSNRAAGAAACRNRIRATAAQAQP